jgi:transposase
MPRKSPYRVELTDQERSTLEALARKYTSPYRDVIRAKIVLLAAEGLGNDVIASRLDTPRRIVSKWRQRFCLLRLPGLEEQPRGGRPARFFPQRRGRRQGPRL